MRRSTERQLSRQASSGERRPPAYQIEGATTEDGRGESIWDRFCAEPGKVRNGENGAVACDFYHRYPEDVALMRELGRRRVPLLDRVAARAARRAAAASNEAGLDFYDRLVDALLEAGIKPFVDALPLGPAAGARGRGRLAGARDGRRVRRVRRGRRRPARRPRRALDHAERAVGRVLARATASASTRPGAQSRARRARGGAPPAALARPGRRGAPPRVARRAGRDHARPLRRSIPRRAHEDDVAAARHFDGFHNRWFLDPVFRGAYPADMLEHFGADAPPGRGRRPRADRRPARLPRRQLLHAATSSRGARTDGAPVVHHPGLGLHGHGLGGPPGRALRRCSCGSQDEYAPPPIYITENGAAFGDVRGHDGTVRDPERQAYIEQHVGVIAPRDRRGRARRRLLRLVAARQLRVGARLLASASASSTSTTRRWSGSRSRASTGTATSSPQRARESRSRPEPADRRRYNGRPRRGGRAVECGGLENI